MCLSRVESVPKLGYTTQHSGRTKRFVETDWQLTFRGQLTDRSNRSLSRIVCPFFLSTDSRKRTRRVRVSTVFQLRRIIVMYKKEAVVAIL